MNKDSIGSHDHLSKVKSIDVMLHTFLDTDPPPKGDKNSPNYGTTDCLKLQDRGTKDLRVELKERNMSSAGRIVGMRRRCKNCKLHVAIKLNNGKVISGGKENTLVCLSFFREGDMLI